MSKEKKKPNLKVRLAFLYVFSFIATIAPLAVCFAINLDKYTAMPSDSVKLALGGGLLLVFVALKVVGKVKLPPRIVVFGIVFVLAYLLKTILADLMLLSGMAFLGEVIDALLFQRAIKRTKEEILVGKTADATSAQVEEVLKKYIGGRV